MTKEQKICKPEGNYVWLCYHEWPTFCGKLPAGRNLVGNLTENEFYVAPIPWRHICVLFTGIQEAKQKHISFKVGLNFVVEVSMLRAFRESNYKFYFTALIWLIFTWRLKDISNVIFSVMIFAYFVFFKSFLIVFYLLIAYLTP